MILPQLHAQALELQHLRAVALEFTVISSTLLFLLLQLHCDLFRLAAKFRASLEIVAQLAPRIREICLRLPSVTVERFYLCNRTRKLGLLLPALLLQIL